MTFLGIACKCQSWVACTTSLWFWLEPGHSVSYKIVCGEQGVCLEPMDAQALPSLYWANMQSCRKYSASAFLICLERSETWSPITKSTQTWKPILKYEHSCNRSYSTKSCWHNCKANQILDTKMGEFRLILFCTLMFRDSLCLRIDQSYGYMPRIFCYEIAATSMTRTPMAHLTCLLKYTENFITKNGKFSNKIFW